MPFELNFCEEFVLYSTFESKFIVTAFFVVTMLLILGIILLTWHAHRQNIKRLLAGEEHETGWLDMIYDLKLKKLKKKALKKEQNNKDK